MKQLLFLAAILSGAALAAEEPLLQKNAGLKMYICQRAFHYALHACHGDPWSCPVSEPYKNGFKSWWYQRMEEVSAQQAQLKNAPQQNAKILRVIMDALAEDARHPQSPGRLASLATSCGIARGAPAPNEDEGKFIEMRLSREPKP